MAGGYAKATFAEKNWLQAKIHSLHSGNGELCNAYALPRIVTLALVQGILKVSSGGS